MNQKPCSGTPVPDRNAEPALQTHWSLVERLKDWDDQTGWRDFFTTYRGLIYGVALKAGLTETEAQEVVQETVISLAKKMPDFKCDRAAGSFKGFLLQITGRRITDQFRKRATGARKLMASESAETPPAACAASPDDGSRTATVERVRDPAANILEKLWDDEWEKSLMKTAIEVIKRKSDPEQFQMFELHVLREFPVKLVADKLGVSAAQVYFAKYKISHLLKREILRLEKQT